jgi:hypothetical protein
MTNKPYMGMISRRIIRGPKKEFIQMKDMTLKVLSDKKVKTKSKIFE